MEPGEKVSLLLLCILPDQSTFSTHEIIPFLLYFVFFDKFLAFLGDDRLTEMRGALTQEHASHLMQFLS